MDLADPQTPSSQRSVDPPDWQSISRGVNCPLCDYNLRGLIEPRCPECGYQFEWDRILHPERDLHPYLFEHHPRRNTRSFFQTLFRSPLSPAKFWYTLEPSHKVRTGRLLLYWLIYAAVPLLAVLGAMVWMVWDKSRSYTNTFLWTTKLRYAATETEWSGVIALAVLFALFPWFNFVALLIFQQSMRRSRVRPVHVLRCAIYCGDLTLFFAIGLIATMSVVEPSEALQTLGHPLNSLFLGGAAYLGQRPLLILPGVCVLTMALLNATRLWVAYRAYLRFQRAVALIVASQIVVILTIVAVLSWTSEHVR